MSIAALDLLDTETYKGATTGAPGRSSQNALSVLGPITVRPAPRREPSFDDETGQLQLVGPMDRTLPFQPIDHPISPGLSASQDAFGHRPTSREDLPDPVAFSRRLLVGALEAFAGHRSIAQLSPYLSRGVFAGLARDAENPRITGSWRGNATVRTLHLCEPADGVAEIAAVIAVRNRSRAVALRLEGLDGRWRCVRMQLG